MKPLISVIIPAYNEEKLIGKCLDALDKQTFPKDKYEVIVVDNNSTDDTSKIAKNHGVILLEYKKMNRVGAVRQYGASQSKGSVLAFMDADSLPDPSWLSSIDRLLVREKNVVAVCGVALPLNDPFFIGLGFHIYNQLSRINQIFGVVLPWGCNFAIKKYAFDKIGGYNLSFDTYDDAEMGLKIKKRFGRKSIIYSQELKVYTSTRKHENSKIFGLYVLDNVKNYLNVVVLKREKTVKIRNIR